MDTVCIYVCVHMFVFLLRSDFFIIEIFYKNWPHSELTSNKPGTGDPFPDSQYFPLLYKALSSLPDSRNSNQVERNLAEEKGHKVSLLLTVFLLHLA